MFTWRYLVAHVNNHAFCCKPVWVSFWSSWLPARSLAFVVTTAL
jgi:hypothetical protein